MLLKFIATGLLLSFVVFVSGWGRVLLPRLVVRSVLVLLGTVVSLVAARKSVELFVHSTGSAMVNPDVNLQTGEARSDAEAQPQQDARDESESAAPGEETEAGAPGESSPESAGESTPDDLDEDAEVQELAEMVSQTMAEDEE